MQTATLVVRHKVGLHARPAALFVQTAMAYQSTIAVTKDGASGNARSILAILALGVNQDDEITISAEGPDEQEALAALIGLIESNFGE
jgi:phosphocarrier protein